MPAWAPLPLPLCCAPHLLQENHLPVQTLEEGLLLHLLSPEEQGGVSAVDPPGAAVWLQWDPSPLCPPGLTHAPCSPAAG